jgi:hypothetical protein
MLNQNEIGAVIFCVMSHTEFIKVRDFSCEMKLAVIRTDVAAPLPSLGVLCANTECDSGQRRYINITNSL